MPKAMIVCADTRAGEAGISILERGGNAVDASIAVAAMLNVVDFASTGIGGDMFALVWMANEGHVRALNGSGRSPYAATMERYAEVGHTMQMPLRGPLTITTPGALAGWQMLLGRYGTMPLGELLEPAIKTAEEGAAVTERMSMSIGPAADALRECPAAAEIFLPGGKVPPAGYVLRQQDLAGTFRTVAEEGIGAFYGGAIAVAIEKGMGECGGLLASDDLASHTSDWIEPISTMYRGYEVFEMPPNSQGIVLLEELNIIEGWDMAALSPAERIVRQIEAKRAAFADRDVHVTDPEFYEAPVATMLDKDYAAKRRAGLNLQHVAANMPMGDLPEPRPSDTTTFAVVDAAGNCVSFINSLFANMGSCVVAEGTGVLFQGRAAGFQLDPKHVNRLEPHKRTLHTLNPVMVLKGGRPYLVMGTIGGDQQTPGTMQVFVNHIDLGMDIREAVYAPRWCNRAGLEFFFEPGIGAATVEDVVSRGYEMCGSEAFFGGAQAIHIDPTTGERTGVSDPRVGGGPVTG